jgi:DNA-directed RNA polymerase specialized sigma24 family protein
MDLTPGGLDLLLARLNADRDEAARKYVDLFRKLARFLALWGCSRPEEQADEALARTAEKMRAGAEIENLNRYTLGVAHLVYKESVRSEISQRNALKERSSEAKKDQSYEERRARCYAQCVKGLSSEDQDLIVRYYRGSQPPDREKLAKQMGISLNVLRVSAFRIRQKLGLCLNECVKQQSKM